MSDTSRQSRFGLAERIWNRARKGLVRRWPFSEIVAPFPGVVAHHRPRGLRDFLRGHKRAFHQAAVVEGRPASDYFGASGIAQLADTNGGICTFRMGDALAVYQSTNTPRVDDDALAPALDANRHLFGDFMGSLPNDDPRRRGKRLSIETTFGNPKFIRDVEPEARLLARDFLREHACRPIALDDFALNLVAHVDSHVPGLLDLRQRPLTWYLATPEYGRLARDFFDIASEVIGKVNSSAARDIEMLVPFVRAVLTDNFDCLEEAPETNVVRQCFAQWERPFSRASIAALGTTELNELATILVASYDTTGLSLLWAIGYVEETPSVKQALIAATPSPTTELPVADLIVLEAVRLAGSNPTALYRRVTSAFSLQHQGSLVTIPEGTMMWLDRRRANQDPLIYPHPERFDLDNIRALLRSERENLSSLLSRGRYEINSFSMIHSHRNPRKCPGRLLSVRFQAILLEELYGAHDITTRGVDLELRDFSAMPRPRKSGTITVTPNGRDPANVGPADPSGDDLQIRGEAPRARERARRRGHLPRVRDGALGDGR